MSPTRTLTLPHPTFFFFEGYLMKSLAFIFWKWSTGHSGLNWIQSFVLNVWSCLMHGNPASESSAAGCSHPAAVERPSDRMWLPLIWFTPSLHSEARVTHSSSMWWVAGKWQVVMVNETSEYKWLWKLMESTFEVSLRHKTPINSPVGLKVMLCFFLFVF